MLVRGALRVRFRLVPRAKRLADTVRGAHGVARLQTQRVCRASKPPVQTSQLVLARSPVDITSKYFRNHRLVSTLVTIG